MKKISIALIAVLSLVIVGCGGSSTNSKKKAKQPASSLKTTVCSTSGDTSATGGIDKITLETKGEEVKKLEMSMEIDAETMGMSAEDGAKAAQENAKAMTVKGLEYKFEASGEKVVATIYFDLEKVDFDDPTISKQLDGISGDDITSLKLSDYKKDLQKTGMTCK